MARNISPQLRVSTGPTRGNFTADGPWFAVLAVYAIRALTPLAAIAIGVFAGGGTAVGAAIEWLTRAF